MRILFFQWFAFMQKGIENALKKMNVSYDVFYYDMKAEQELPDGEFPTVEYPNPEAKDHSRL